MTLVASLSQTSTATAKSISRSRTHHRAMFRRYSATGAAASARRLISASGGSPSRSSRAISTATAKSIWRRSTRATSRSRYSRVMVAGHSPSRESLPGTRTARAIVAADFNGDRRLDLATANDTVNNLSVYLADGRGGFAVPKTYAVGARPFSLVARDLNGDGLRRSRLGQSQGGQRVGAAGRRARRLRCAARIRGRDDADNGYRRRFRRLIGDLISRS